MNIFILDLNPKVAAEYHCDDHVRKMAIEACQMLAVTVYYLNGIKTRKERLNTDRASIARLWQNYPISDQTLQKYGDGGPGFSFLNHPCTIWVRQSSANFSWLIELATEVCNQFEAIYGHEIKCKNQLKWFSNWLNINKEKFPSHELTTFAQAMPEEYKHCDPVIAYRNY